MSRASHLRLRLVASIFALPLAHAGAQDLIFTDEFEPMPVCSGQGLAASLQPPLGHNVLATSTRYVLRVRSCSYVGALTLATSSAPSSWNLSFDPPSPIVNTNTIAMAELFVEVPTDGDGGLHAFAADVSGGGHSASAAASLDIANEFVITIPVDAGGGDHHLPPHLDLKVGSTLRFLNADATPHRIHMTGSIPGMDHQQISMSQGEEYDVTSTGVGTDNDVYCHDHGSVSGVMSITVHP